jgi:hypothetical protein
MNKVVAEPSWGSERPVRRVGRQPKLPLTASRAVVEMHSRGMSSQAIVMELRSSGYDVSRWTVRRVVKGLRPYQEPTETESLA